MKYDETLVELAVYNLIKGLGINLKDPDIDSIFKDNFQGTPKRVARAFRELCRGLYERDKIEEILSTTFPCDYDEMVVVTDIEAVGVCPHHLMPVRYKIHVGYIPSKNGMVLGLSKIPRLVCLLAARPVLQEQLTKDIADIFEANLEPLGVMVVVNGVRSCIQRQVDGLRITSVTRGVFEDALAKTEFLNLTGK